MEESPGEKSSPGFFLLLRASRRSPEGDGLRAPEMAAADRSAECEGELDRDRDRDWLAFEGARSGSPLACGLDRFLIEAEGGVERPHHLDIAHRAGRLDNALDKDGALDFGAHRVGRVLRPDLAQKYRRCYATAQPVD